MMVSAPASIFLPTYEDAFFQVSIKIGNYSSLAFIAAFYTTSGIPSTLGSLRSSSPDTS